MTYFSPRKINDLEGRNQHIVCFSAKPSRLCTYKEKKNMSIYQHFREDLFINIYNCRIIYNRADPQTIHNQLSPLALVILTKILSYILLTVFTMATIYYALHFACLLDDACFALNYEVKI